MIPKRNSQLLSFLFVFILALLPLYHLLQPGLPVTHDGQDHVVRIANFYASLQEGNFIPRWGNNLNWGFGHPVLMFLYPLPSYLSSMFHKVGFSFVDSVKLVFAVTYAVSAFTMFFWIRRKWGDAAGVVSALLYIYAPYRFVDLSVRGALGEHVAFLFLPLILLGIDVVAERRRLGIILLGFSIAGLVLSHNAVSIMMLPVIAVYTGVLFIKHKQIGFLVRLCAAGCLGVLLSSFFLIPALFEGKYTLRDIVTQGEAITRFVPFSWFVYSPWNYGGGQEFTKQIGLVQWCFLILAAVVMVVKKISFRLQLIVWFCLFWGTLWMMTESSRFVWESVTILQKFQFPWRFLTITVFTGAVIAGIITSWFGKKTQQMLVVLMAISLLLTTASMWPPKAMRQYEEQFFTGIYKSTTDTGESSPIWSVRFMEFSPDVPLQIAAGTAEYIVRERSTTTREYLVTVTETATLVENTLYFPGWRIFANGVNLPIEFQNPEWRGRMTFQLTPGVYTVKVAFTDTRLRQVANMLTGIGVASSICILFWEGFRKRLHL